LASKTANTRRRQRALSRLIRDRVERATVKLKKLGGKGVLVPGGYILTAAHCLEWDGRGGMVLGDHFLETIITADGKELLTEVRCAEPCADIAVLGVPDNQTFYDEAEALEEWCEQTTPVSLRTTPVPHSYPNDEFLIVHFQNLAGGWMSGRVARYGLPLEEDAGSVVLQCQGGELVSGMSGSPIVDDAGGLVGVISNGTKEGSMPVAFWALPRSLCDAIVAQAMA
jgi:hypothetical protein